MTQSDIIIKIHGSYHHRKLCETQLKKQTTGEQDKIEEDIENTRVHNIQFFCL